MGKLTYEQMRRLADVGEDSGKLTVKNKQGHVIRTPLRKWTNGPMLHACTSVPINGGSQGSKGSKHCGVRRSVRESGM